MGWAIHILLCTVSNESPEKIVHAGQAAGVGLDEMKMCPLAHEFDYQIHDAIANMRRLDGSLPPHSEHGRSVDFFTNKGKRKYWVKANTPVFGYMFFYTLDKVVCPFLADAFGQTIWHPHTFAEL